MQASRHLPEKFVINGVDYRYWREELKDLNDAFLLAGFRHSGTFHGFLNWSELRKLCIDGRATEVEQSRRTAPTTARLSDMRTVGNARFQELAKVTHAMQAEEGKGPITRATLDNRLTANIVRGKSAQEIIAYCQKLYA